MFLSNKTRQIVVVIKMGSICSKFNSFFSKFKSDDKVPTPCIPRKKCYSVKIVNQKIYCQNINSHKIHLIFQKGVISRVADGDTVTFVPDDKSEDEWKIRLAEIDAPESDQPGGKESTQFLKVGHNNLCNSNLF